MDVKYIIVLLAIIAVFLYTFLITKVRHQGSDIGIPFSKKFKSKKSGIKKVRPVIPEPESSVSWEEDEEDLEEELEEIDLHWRGGVEKEETVKKIKEKKTREIKEKREEKKDEEEREDVEAAVDNERRRVKLLWKSYLQKVDAFIEKLEKGTSKRYFEYYKEYKNLDKFYSRFIFNFGLHLSETDKKKASGRLGYCSTLLREMLSEV